MNNNNNNSSQLLFIIAIVILLILAIYFYTGPNSVCGCLVFMQSFTLSVHEMSRTMLEWWKNILLAAGLHQNEIMADALFQNLSKISMANFTFSDNIQAKRVYKAYSQMMYELIVELDRVDACVKAPLECKPTPGISALLSSKIPGAIHQFVLYDGEFSTLFKQLVAAKDCRTF